MQSYCNLDLKCGRRQLTGPVNYGNFRETGPRTIDARQVFQSGKKKLKTSPQLFFYFLQGSRTSPLLGIPISLNTSAVASFCRLLFPFIMLSFRLSNIYRSKDTKKYLLFIYRTSSSTIDVKRAYLDLYYA